MQNNGEKLYNKELILTIILIQIKINISLMII